MKKVIIPFAIIVMVQLQSCVKKKAKPRYSVVTMADSEIVHNPVNINNKKRVTNYNWNTETDIHSTSNSNALTNSNRTFARTKLCVRFVNEIEGTSNVGEIAHKNINNHSSLKNEVQYFIKKPPNPQIALNKSVQKFNDARYAKKWIYNSKKKWVATGIITQGQNAFVFSFVYDIMSDEVVVTCGEVKS